MPSSVVVLGGGVGGMSAAHELAERGFGVRVFERRDDGVPGGKARSVRVPGTAVGGRRDLPGEHGFRFFPGFYRHVTDTMRRIPFGDNADGVLGNLVGTQKVMLSREGPPPLVMLAHFPRSLADLRTLLGELHEHPGLPADGVETFAERLWQLLTSCPERRLAEYEKTCWWDFIEADRFGSTYQSLLARGMTRMLVAAKADAASARTVGDILLQLLLNMGTPGVAVDRVLNGPTNDVWLDPWLAHLQRLGVDYTFDATLVSLAHDGQRVTGARVRHGDGTEEVVTADHYVVAVPVERMAQVLDASPGLAEAAGLGGVCGLAEDVAWMTGLQLYLSEDVRVNPGHVSYVDSPWALTSISQAQFWDSFPMSEFGDGRARTVLSVDISDWDTAAPAPSPPAGPADDRPDDADAEVSDQPARLCSRAQVAGGAWAQLKASLNRDGHDMLRDDMLLGWYLDRDIVREAVQKEEEAVRPPHGVVGATAVVPGPDDAPLAQSGGLPAAEAGFRTVDEEPLLVNNVDTWRLRPEATTALPNLYLASDYVRTYTDLATMEGANEAARRATNAILDAEGSRAARCRVWSLHEPWVLAPLRWLDRRRFRQGEPWRNAFPLPLRLLHDLLARLHDRRAPR